MTEHELLIFLGGVVTGATTGYLYDRFLLRRLVEWRAAFLRGR